MPTNADIQRAADIAAALSLSLEMLRNIAHGKSYPAIEYYENIGTISRALQDARDVEYIAIHSSK
jgi:hypothetical protein